MHNAFDIIMGPLVWIAVILFLAGSAYKVINYFLLAKKSDPFVIEYWSWKYALRSFGHWLNPFSAYRWRTMPVLAAVTFVFHICLVLVPLFLSGHLVLLQQYVGISWPSLPAGVADTFTVIVMLGCLYFFVRRISTPEVRFVTRPGDYVLLFLVFGTFLTGFMANYQIGPYGFMVLLHILFGEAFLVMIPFTRVAHMLYAPLSRGYIGSEFGGVRHCIDW